MSSSISVRFAMDTWGIMFQTMVPGTTTSFLLAKEMGNLLRLSLENLAMVKQVACSSANDRGLFNLYVKFDSAPEPMIAIKFLSMACLELKGLHFEVYSSSQKSASKHVHCCTLQPFVAPPTAMVS